MIVLYHDTGNNDKTRSITHHPIDHLTDAMRENQQSDTGKATYNMRISTVDPVHADLNDIMNVKNSVP